ncbi:unnamed protein product [Nesidiocoris tenuis]|uniref:Uncharacterized protein n=1 Tax=Nesidiocoris tenuis TaxID=355587 RepID=A0A6H5H3X3_9HEMI|nr:unnamed protein product [Nesidiocoris tenuis]
MEVKTPHFRNVKNIHIFCKARYLYMGRCACVAVCWTEDSSLLFGVENFATVIYSTFPGVQNVRTSSTHGISLSFQCVSSNLGLSSGLYWTNILVALKLKNSNFWAGYRPNERQRLTQCDMSCHEYEPSHEFFNYLSQELFIFVII